MTLEEMYMQAEIYSNDSGGTNEEGFFLLIGELWRMTAEICARLEDLPR